MTCAKYTNMRTVFDKPTITMVTSWTQGYLTSINVIRMNSHQDSLRYADMLHPENLPQPDADETGVTDSALLQA